MAIDVLNEKTLTFTQAAKRLPSTRQNRAVSPNTIYRWAAFGVRGVRLETAFRGGTRVTSEQALQRFFAALNSQPVPRCGTAQAAHDDAVESALIVKGY
jgi:hypothetical protein